MVRAKNKEISNYEQPVVEKFWALVDKRTADECWLWQGKLTTTGYGYVQIYKQEKFTAHRVAYFLHYKKQPGDLFVCHKCDVPLCCNPHHLFLGTQKDNRVDCKQKGRTATGRRQGQYTKPDAFPKGEQCSWATLTEAIIKEARILIATGMTQKAAAELLKVGYTTLNKALKGRNWKHIAP